MAYKLNYTFLMRFLLICLMVGLIYVVGSSGLYAYLSVAHIKAHAALLNNYVQEYYWLTVWFYIAAFIILVICCLPGTALMSMLGGFLFGMLSGIFYINIAATTGAAIFFLLVRYLIGSLLQKRYGHAFGNFNAMVNEKGWIFLLMLRCIPLIPFFMVNIIAGLTTVRLFTFIWTTSIGILPTSFIFTYVGKQLGQIKKIEDFFSFPMILAMVLLVLLLLVSMIIKKKSFTKQKY